MKGVFIMVKYQPEFSTLEYILSKKVEPDFNQLLKVLNGERPDRVTLFEFFLNGQVYKKLAGDKYISSNDVVAMYRNRIFAFASAGYDYATVSGSEFGFPSKEIHRESSISLNEGVSITDRQSFNTYQWHNPQDYDYSRLNTLENDLPKGMKLIVSGPGGVLENAINLVGYDNLCYMIVDDPELVKDIFDNIGSRLVTYYKICARFDSVGALIVNDDWGFNTQTLISPNDLRKYVIPWHKKIVEEIHMAGKPAILHSCGNLKYVMDDIINDIKFEAKHSYEDNIMPVEQVYDKWAEKISVLGGIDVNFLCNKTPEEVYNRAVELLDRSKKYGGYALGSGNSIPEYIPEENYFAMIAAVLANR